MSWKRAISARLETLDSVFKNILIWTLNMILRLVSTEVSIPFVSINGKWISMLFSEGQVDELRNASIVALPLDFIRKSSSLMLLLGSRISMMLLCWIVRRVYVLYLFQKVRRLLHGCLVIWEPPLNIAPLFHVLWLGRYWASLHELVRTMYVLKMQLALKNLRRQLNILNWLPKYALVHTHPQICFN
jgi:hypothetical protein